MTLVNPQWPDLPFGSRPAEHRIQQYCDVCHQWDDHPRHHVMTTDPSGAPLTLTRHMDCCAENGCPDMTCNLILDHAGDKRGPDLVEHIQTFGNDIHELRVGGNGG